jgi:hypothetical protein
MADVYKIGVSIALANGISPVIALISKDLLGLGTRIGEVESAFKRLGGIPLTGILGVAGAIVGMVELVEKTKDLSHALVQIEKLGITPEQQAEVYKMAKELPFEVPGITQKDVADTFGVAYSPFGFAGAMQMLKPLEEFSVVVGNAMGNFDKVQEDIVKAIRSGELLGAFVDKNTHAIDLDKAQEYLNTAKQVIAATHGVVNLNTLLGLAQQGGPALMNLSKEGMASVMMMSQMMGGPRAGTAMMSLWQQMAGGVMYRRTAEAMQDLGLLKPGEWYMSAGHVVLEDVASKRLTAQMGKDPLEWIQKTIMPALENKGLKGEDTRGGPEGGDIPKGITDPDDQIRWVFKFLQRQTTQRFTADMMRNMNQLLSERERILHGLTIPESLGAQTKDVEQAMHNVSTAFQNLLYTLGGTGENVASALNKLAAAIDTVHRSLQWLQGWWGEMATPRVITPGIPTTPPGASVPAVPEGVPPTPAVPGKSWLPDWWNEQATPRVITPGIPTTPPGASVPAVPGPQLAPPAPPTAPAEPGKQSYNAVPPPSGSSSDGGSGGAVYLDGQKVADILMPIMARLLGGPQQGSAYPDYTQAGMAPDTYT